MVEQIKIRKIIVSDSLEISGLSQFQGQEVEITVVAIAASSSSTIHTPDFMRFAGIAADEAALLEKLEQEILANRALKSDSSQLPRL